MSVILYSLKTELRGSVARSWLRVSQAGRRDSGIYYCNVTNLAAASVTIHVVPGGSSALVVACIVVNVLTEVIVVVIVVKIKGVKVLAIVIVATAIVATAAEVAVVV